MRNGSVSELICWRDGPYLVYFTIFTIVHSNEFMYLQFFVAIDVDLEHSQLDIMAYK